MSSHYLLIENKGTLDVSSLILLGASTKRNDESKIGFFGSGNKYAIATLIRDNIPFKIFSGEREINIKTEKVSFRDMSFKKIIIDGQPTSLTTDMGPQWKPWMAIREWVSNSIDEGSHNIVADTESISGREGYTRFYVQHHSSIKDIVNAWDNYFTFDRDDSICSDGNEKIFTQTNERNDLVLYRRGIRVYFDTGTTSLYQYDLHNYEINESRLIDSIYNAEYVTAKFLAKNATLQVATNILNKAFVESHWEGRLPWRWAVSSLSPVWREAIGNHAIIVDNVAGYFMEIQHRMPFYIVSLDMAQQIRKSFPEIKIYGMDDGGQAIGYKIIEMNPKQQFLLKECLRFCEETKYDIEYPIEVVKFEEGDVLGRAHQGKILLSDKIFDKGRKEIVLTMIEENEHLKTGFKDNTRAFQNHLFNLFLTEKENRFGFFL